MSGEVEEVGGGKQRKLKISLKVCLKYRLVNYYPHIMVTNITLINNQPKVAPQGATLALSSDRGEISTQPLHTLYATPTAGHLPPRCISSFCSRTDHTNQRAAI
ncbi:hypothetical protein, unlikely [Trypanosoma brucei gambiense DAL972]|uniref:Uncharacterized protein n=1 Tax=Trypanosoma brucei gambiense (strain MHOM/CI/86/DAL972) TaxID=679716 RepID=C9ZLR2_TRYB9|nr:hypothetical protein, unlikely [Trypanosoma brucei gambiense DAL972]CBH10337.1 hypothetical protein, unlikely [Trypanosoma brucei gambiense DAL972]|eukprot:XP_011772627.1 hypothetical protein, unlikely [Trypanosoma brucei gambiense DAL972]